ncbi:hypothetical protein FGG08_000704 [Glutinoglossum americanum]|uniref:Cytochrome b5 heme-binding domain-containing protein n=1 Tax=Glutinoglossum americanum TaxID=1670608 RepID=A0A9P8L5W1_9PEZI|nr:hypothetical protein FGG08_000704 [Glutinoglossum americanum]
MATKELTYDEVSDHNTKKNLYVVIHDQVYDVSNFVDEHPGGDEVLLDVGGLDATEAFEDVGHSDEAREILSGHLVAKLKRKPGDPIPKVAPPAGTTTTSPDAGFGVGIYALILIGGLVAFFGYRAVWCCEVDADVVMDDRGVSRGFQDMDEVFCF